VIPNGYLQEQLTENLLKESEKLFEESSAFTEKISGWLEGSKVSSEAFLQ